MVSLFAQRAGRSAQLLDTVRLWRDFCAAPARFHAVASALSLTAPEPAISTQPQQQQQPHQLFSTCSSSSTSVFFATATGSGDLLRFANQQSNVSGARFFSLSSRMSAGVGGPDGGRQSKGSVNIDEKRSTIDSIANVLWLSPLTLPTSHNAIDTADTGPPAAAKKPGIIAQFKDLYKRYWYVMVPVHVVTSTGWMVAFYYLSKSGVDVPELLRSIDVSDSIVSRFEQSKMGHLAIAYLCYKIATPVRYAVTVGGTTVSIKYLSQWGWIKPLPSNERLLEIYADKKALVKAGYAEIQSKATDAMSGPKSEGGSGGAGSETKK